MTHSFPVVFRPSLLGQIAAALLAALLPATCVATPTPTRTHTDTAHGFRVQVPASWADVQLAGRMVWHVAARNGTALPDCGVIVTQDVAFKMLSVDQYVATQSKQKVLAMLALNFGDPLIGAWEPDFRLGGQRALHYIYSGTLDDRRQTTMIWQTTRNGRLYTFSCNTDAEQFPLVYTDLLHLADTFAFVPLAKQ